MTWQMKLPNLQFTMIWIGMFFSAVCGFLEFTFIIFDDDTVELA